MLSSACIFAPLEAFVASRSLVSVPGCAEWAESYRVRTRRGVPKHVKHSYWLALALWPPSNPQVLAGNISKALFNHFQSYLTPLRTCCVSEPLSKILTLSLAKRCHSLYLCSSSQLNYVGTSKKSKGGIGHNIFTAFGSWSTD